MTTFGGVSLPFVFSASGDGFPPSFFNLPFKVTDTVILTDQLNQTAAASQQIFGANQGRIEWRSTYAISPSGPNVIPADEYFSPQGAGAPAVDCRLIGMVQGVFDNPWPLNVWRTIFTNGANSDQRVSTGVQGNPVQAIGVFEMRDTATQTLQARWRFNGTARRL